MKKISTLSLALLVASSVYAVEPTVIQVSETSGDLKTSEAQVVKVVKAAEASNADAMLRSKFDMQAKAPSRADGGDVTVQYGFPTGSLFNYPTFSVAGEPGHLLASPTFVSLPAFADVTYPNNSFKLENGKPVRARDLNYVWTFGEGENAYDEESSYSLTIQSYPGVYCYPYGQAVPVLSLDGKTFQLGQEGQTESGQTQFFPSWIVAGGAPYVSQEQIDRWNNNPQTSTWSDFDAAFKLIDMGVEGVESYYNEGAFMLGFSQKSDAVNRTWEEVLGQSLEEGEMDHVSDVKLGGLGMLIADPGQVWSVSEVSAYFSCYLEAGATFDICFYALNSDNTPNFDKEILKYTYEAEAKVGTLSKNANLEVNIPFITVDEYGDELSYKAIDGGMFMVINNFNDNVKKLCPTMAGYPYNNSGTVVNNYLYNTLFALVDCQYDGADKSYVVDNPYIFGDEAKNEWTLPVGFNIMLKAEYPYLQADSYASNETEGWVATEEGVSEFEMSIKSAADTRIYRVLCPASLENVVISGPNGTEIPEWLTVSAEAGNDYFEGLQSNMDVRAFVIQFALTDGATPSGTEIYVSYKGHTNIFKVNPELSGIEGVVDNGAETVASEYYDLQGRKLYNEPANGLFIRKDIKADGSVKSVKVVK